MQLDGGRALAPMMERGVEGKTAPCATNSRGTNLFDYSFT